MADSQRKTANLFDGILITGYFTSKNFTLDTTSNNYRSIRLHLESGTYTFSFEHPVRMVRVVVDDTYYENVAENITEYTITITNDNYDIGISFRDERTSTPWDNSPIMLNTGSTALPYEPYGWVHSLRKLGTSTDTITTLPADVYADGNNATVGLVGNMSQTGSPTPQNPIQPSECGERTGNFFDEVYPNISSTTQYISIYVGSGTYTLSTTTPALNVDYTQLFFLAGQVTTGASSPTNGVSNIKSRTVTAQNGYVTIAYRSQAASVNPKNYSTMLNLGETALPYEPHGVKIPILSANTTTPVYLGEVQTTRKIKKLVFDGTEDWSYDGTVFYINISSMTEPVISNSPLYCSHFVNSLQGMRNGTNWAFVTKYETATTTSDWKTYLAQQYANNTPVCVWYVLATEKTGIVNEPIRKIGDYADEVSGITIPTIAGANTLSIGTTLQPSEVTVNYKGWHPVADVHVYPDSSWMPTSWEEFRKVVRSGKAQSLYPVGTKLYENWGDTTSDAWIVVDYPTGEDYLDSDLAQQGYTNRVMLMEEKLNYLRQFDAIEGWLYVETAIPAGTYRFTIPNHDASYGGNKTYIFTSTANVPVGGQLTLTWNYQQNPSAVQAYSSATSTSALFNVSITEWDGTTACTDLGTIKLAQNDPDSAYGKLNHIHRARYGSNNYAQSGYRQWLNTNASANWWTPTNVFDRPYGNRTNAGRLNVMNSNMKSVLATPTVNCITNNLFEYPSLDGTTFSLQTAYTVKDKLFPVTHSEINLSSSPNVNSVLDYYVGKGNADRIKYRKDNGNAYYWWVRTPYPTSANGVRFVYTSGALNGNGAYDTGGSAAACIIQ